PHFGDTHLEAVEEEIDAYVLKRREDGVSHSTINRETAVLSHMLHYAARKKRWLRHLPYIERLEEVGAREREWSEAEEEALLGQFDQDLRDLVEAALLLGVRQSDLTRLTVAQVDLEARVISFPAKKKGRKRVLPIGERLYYLLARRINGSGLSPTDLVFLNGSRRWERWHIRNRLQTAMKRVGISNLRFHDLRHTAGSRLRRRGADMEDIRRILGHRGKQTTEGYVHYQAEQLRPVLALLESTKVTQDGQLVSGKPSNPL
ncbi:MAG: site-specific integrase, partial [candidate division NC10 bacterium]